MSDPACIKIHFALLEGYFSVSSQIPKMGFACQISSKPVHSAFFLQALLSSGANVDEKDKDGKTGLMQAAIRGHLQIAQVRL